MRAFLNLLWLIPVLAFAQRDKFEISGQVSGLANGSLVFLTDANNPTDTLSRDFLKEGNSN